MTCGIVDRESDVRCQHQPKIPRSAQRVSWVVSAVLYDSPLKVVLSDLRKLGMNLVPFPRVGRPEL